MQNIMEANEVEDKEAVRFVSEVYHEDRELYNRANEVVKQLGLDGLWRGVHLAHKVVIEALQAEQYQKCGCSNVR